MPRSKKTASDMTVITLAPDLDARTVLRWIGRQAQDRNDELDSLARNFPDIPFWAGVMLYHGGSCVVTEANTITMHREDFS